MIRKSLLVLGITLLLFVMQSCTSKPEKGLLTTYFHSDSMTDRTTMATMALEPISIGAKSWKIVNVSEELTEPAALPELNQKELELKKKVEESVGITIGAKEEVDDGSVPSLGDHTADGEQPGGGFARADGWPGGGSSLVLGRQVG